MGFSISTRLNMQSLIAPPAIKWLIAITELFGHWAQLFQRQGDRVGERVNHHVHHALVDVELDRDSESA